jgi:hypothetical protein
VGKNAEQLQKDTQDYPLGINSDSSGLVKYKTINLGSRRRDETENSNNSNKSSAIYELLSKK